MATTPPTGPFGSGGRKRPPVGGPILSDWRWSLLAAVLGAAALGYSYWQTGDVLYLLAAVGYVIAIAIVVKTARM